MALVQYQPSQNIERLLLEALAEALPWSDAVATALRQAHDRSGPQSTRETSRRRSGLRDSRRDFDTPSLDHHNKAGRPRGRRGSEHGNEAPGRQGPGAGDAFGSSEGPSPAAAAARQAVELALMTIGGVPGHLIGSAEGRCSAAAFTLSLAMATASKGGLPPALLHLVSPYRAHLEELRQLGKGGFGSVVAVRSRLDHRLMAVKSVAFRSQVPPWAPPEQLEGRHAKLLREVQALAGLDGSPHVVRYYSAWIEPAWDKLGQQLRRSGAGRAAASTGAAKSSMKSVLAALAAAAAADSAAGHPAPGGASAPVAHSRRDKSTSLRKTRTRRRRSPAIGQVPRGASSDGADPGAGLKQQPCRITELDRESATTSSNCSSQDDTSHGTHPTEEGGGQSRGRGTRRGQLTATVPAEVGALPGSGEAAGAVGGAVSDSRTRLQYSRQPGLGRRRSTTPPRQEPIVTLPPSSSEPTLQAQELELQDSEDHKALVQPDPCRSTFASLATAAFSTLSPDNDADMSSGSADSIGGAAAAACGLLQPAAAVQPALSPAGTPSSPPISLLAAGAGPHRALVNVVPLPVPPPSRTSGDARHRRIQTELVVSLISSRSASPERGSTAGGAFSPATDSATTPPESVLSSSVESILVPPGVSCSRHGYTQRSQPGGRGGGRGHALPLFLLSAMQGGEMPRPRRGQMVPYGSGKAADGGETRLDVMGGGQQSMARKLEEGADVGRPGGLSGVRGGARAAVVAASGSSKYSGSDDGSEKGSGDSAHSGGPGGPACSDRGPRTRERDLCDGMRIRMDGLDSDDSTTISSTTYSSDSSDSGSGTQADGTGSDFLGSSRGGGGGGGSGLASRSASHCRRRQRLPLGHRRKPPPPPPAPPDESCSWTFDRGPDSAAGDVSNPVSDATATVTATAKAARGAALLSRTESEDFSWTFDPGEPRGQQAHERTTRAAAGVAAGWWQRKPREPSARGQSEGKPEGGAVVGRAGRGAGAVFGMDGEELGSSGSGSSSDRGSSSEGVSGSESGRGSESGSEGSHGYASRGRRRRASSGSSSSSYISGSSSGSSESSSSGSSESSSNGGSESGDYTDTDSGSSSDSLGGSSGLQPPRASTTRLILSPRQTALPAPRHRRHHRRQPSFPIPEESTIHGSGSGDSDTERGGGGRRRRIAAKRGGGGGGAGRKRRSDSTGFSGDKGGSAGAAPCQDLALLHGIRSWPYTLYISMELVVGPTLTRWLQLRSERLTGFSHPPEPSLERSLFRQIVTGLAHVHAAGIIHRDLKPANIFLVPLMVGPQQPQPHQGWGEAAAAGCTSVGGGTAAAAESYLVKLGDFGLAAPHSEPDIVLTAASSLGTATSSTSGHSFTAAAAAASSFVDARADVEGDASSHSGLTLQRHFRRPPSLPLLTAACAGTDGDASAAAPLAVPPPRRRPLSGMPCISGLALSRSRSSASTTTPRTSGIGTASYSAPEQLRQQHGIGGGGGGAVRGEGGGGGGDGLEDGASYYGPEVDIYPLGLILMELFCIFGTGMERANAMRAAREARLPTSFLNAFPGEARLAEACLQARPDRRPTAAQLLTLLDLLWEAPPAAATRRAAAAAATATDPATAGAAVDAFGFVGNGRVGGAPARADRPWTDDVAGTDFRPPAANAATGSAPYLGRKMGVDQEVPGKGPAAGVLGTQLELGEARQLEEAVGGMSQQEGSGPRLWRCSALVLPAPPPPPPPVLLTRSSHQIRGAGQHSPEQQQGRAAVAVLSGAAGPVAGVARLVARTEARRDWLEALPRREGPPAGGAATDAAGSSVTICHDTDQAGGGSCRAPLLLEDAGVQTELTWVGEHASAAAPVRVQVPAPTRDKFRLSPRRTSKGAEDAGYVVPPQSVAPGDPATSPATATSTASAIGETDPKQPSMVPGYAAKHAPDWVLLGSAPKVGTEQAGSLEVEQNASGGAGAGGGAADGALRCGNGPIRGGVNEADSADDRMGSVEGMAAAVAAATEDGDGDERGGEAEAEAELLARLQAAEGEVLRLRELLARTRASYSQG